MGSAKPPGARLGLLVGLMLAVPLIGVCYPAWKLAGLPFVPFDLLISDMGLGDGSGLDLMRQLSLQHGFTRRAIALTGYGMEEDIQRSHQAGFLQHLTKPVDFRRLQSVIQTVLQTDAPPPPAFA